MSHPNAPLTVLGRRLLCKRITEMDWTVTDAARAAGISRQTAHKWLGRFMAWGESGLRDRSSRPMRIRERVSPRDVRRIWRRRRQKEGPLAISWNTGIPRSTVYAVLARNGQGRLGELDREPKTPAVRYEHAAPGDLIHIDVKKLGRLGEGGGWRFGGRVAKRRNVGGGFDFVHVAIDDHSRLAYVEVHADERAETVAGFTERAIGHYASLGIEVRRLITDNAMSYYSHAARRTRSAWRQAVAHEALPTANQRQSGALHPPAHQRPGLRQALRHLQGAPRGAPSLDPQLQLPASARRHRRPATDFTGARCQQRVWAVHLARRHPRAPSRVPAYK